MRTPKIPEPDHSDRFGLDEEFDPPTDDDLNRKAYIAGAVATVAAIALFGLTVTGFAWWVGWLD